jgi:uncharacterized membrane protein
MQVMKDALLNDVLANKKQQGIILFGLGNEPFWNVELNNKDSVSFQIADWSQPVKLKVDSTIRNKDSLFYLAKNDSIDFKLTVLPYFCNDGMSDYVYGNKVQLQYNHQTYKGCGILYK